METNFFIGSFRYLRQYIVKIDTVDTFKFSIEFTTKLEIIRYLLGTLNSGLYKYVEGKLLTSGPFYIKSMDSKRIILKRNPYYLGQHGDVNQVELTSDIKSYSQYIKKNEMRSTSERLQNEGPHKASYEHIKILLSMINILCLLL